MMSSFGSRCCVGVVALSGILSLLACGGTESPPRSPDDAVVAPAASSAPSVPVPAASASGAGARDPREQIPREKASAEPAPKAASAKPILPTAAPRPVTIPLVPEGEDSAYATAIRQGDDAFERNDLAATERAYQSAKKIAPKRSPALVGLARLRIAKTNVPFEFAAGKKNPVVVEAAAELTRIVAADKDNGPALAELGRAQLLLGDAAKVVPSLKRASELLPDHPEVQSSFAIALLATGRTEEALAAFRAASTLDKGSAVRHSHYATALLMRGQVKEAINEYEIAVGLDDADARAHSDLGAALLSDNQLERAVTELERAIALDPKRATFQSNLGYALQQQGKRDAAVAHYRDALRLDDKLVSAWINLATVLAQDPKSRSEARSALERARTLDPTDPRVTANLKELDDLERSKK